MKGAPVKSKKMQKNYTGFILYDYCLFYKQVGRNISLLPTRAEI